jgi:hypothetical protein
VLRFSLSLIFPHLFPFLRHLPISANLLVMPSGRLSCLASTTRSFEYFIQRIIFSHNLKFPKPSGFCMVRYFLYRMNKISDEHHPRVTYLLILTLLASLWSSLF